jgi:sec-independent protein translocase protein TatC
MTEIPFITHLNELKLRGSYILISLLLNIVTCFYFMDSVSLYLIELGKEPISFIFTGLSEIFLTYIKFSLLFGVCLTLPISFIQLYLFFAPGLYIVEQKRLRFYLLIFMVSF